MPETAQSRARAHTAAPERFRRKIELLKGLFEAAEGSNSVGALLRLDRAVVIYLTMFQKFPLDEG
jgi:hypothetical protein